MTTSIDRHNCGLSWCRSAESATEHYGADYTPATGHLVSVEDLTVGVILTYDAAEDTTPNILLHITSLGGEIDADAGPSPDEARAIAAKLLEAADAVDRWVGVAMTEMTIPAALSRRCPVCNATRLHPLSGV
jgi:hypothetical protein